MKRPPYFLRDRAVDVTAFLAGVLAAVLAVCGVIWLAAAVVTIKPAHAGEIRCDNDGRCRQALAAGAPARAHRHGAAVPRGDPRPGQWCAWWLRRYLKIPRSAFPPGAYNLARAFRFIGMPAQGPAPSVIVVWRHHVGIVTGRAASGWVLLSGNDDHRVRERVRSLAGAIAYRLPQSQSGFASAKAGWPQAISALEMQP